MLRKGEEYCVLLPFLASDRCTIIRNGLSGSKKDLGQPLRNRQVCFCLDWVMSCLGVQSLLQLKKKNSGQTRFRGEAQANQR